MKLKKNIKTDIEMTFDVTDEEIVNLISEKTLDEKIVFFRKLLQTDIGKTFPFSLLKGKF